MSQTHANRHPSRTPFVRHPLRVPSLGPPPSWPRFPQDFDDSDEHGERSGTNTRVSDLVHHTMTGPNRTPDNLVRSHQERSPERRHESDGESGGESDDEEDRQRYPLQRFRPPIYCADSSDSDDLSYAEHRPCYTRGASQGAADQQMMRRIAAMSLRLRASRFPRSGSSSEVETRVQMTPEDSDNDSEEESPRSQYLGEDYRHRGQGDRGPGSRYDRWE